MHSRMLDLKIYVKFTYFFYHCLLQCNAVVQKDSIWIYMLPVLNRQQDSIGKAKRRGCI